MDNSKKAEFVRKMGKKRLKLTKRQYLDGGGIAGLLGSAGGAGGTGFNTPSGANADQLSNAYNQNQTALEEQQNLVTALQPQVSTAVNNQNTIANQYAQQAAGLGPNVANTTLNQATQANVANQAALAAGQRGAGANPGLLARQAAETGATAQQQAAGQAATTQAQQQIAAEGAGANLANQQIGQGQSATSANTQAQQGEQSILQNANTANNNIQGQLANTTMQGQQALLGGIGNDAGAVTGLFAHGGNVGTEKLDFVHKMTKMGLEHHAKAPMMLDKGAAPITANADEKQASFRNHFGAPQAQAATPPANNGIPPTSDAGFSPEEAAQRQATRKKYGYDEGGSVNSAAQSAQDSMRKAFHFADGGFTIQAPLEGGFNPGSNAGAAALGQMGSHQKKNKPAVVNGNSSDSTDAAITGSNNPLTMSNQATVMAPMAGGMEPAVNLVAAAHGGMFQGPHKSMVANYLLNKGGKVQAMVSPGEVYLSPEKVDRVIRNGEDPVKVGEKFKGKAKVKGDSLKNDILPKTLETGGVVIDREHMDTAEKRKKFVQKTVAKKRAQR